MMVDRHYFSLRQDYEKSIIKFESIPVKQFNHLTHDCMPFEEIMKTLLAHPSLDRFPLEILEHIGHYAKRWEKVDILKGREGSSRVGEFHFALPPSTSASQFRVVDFLRVIGGSISKPPHKLLCKHISSSETDKMEDHDMVEVGQCLFVMNLNQRLSDPIVILLEIMQAHFINIPNVENFKQIFAAWSKSAIFSEIFGLSRCEFVTRIEKRNLEKISIPEPNPTRSVKDFKQIFAAWNEIFGHSHIILFLICIRQCKFDSESILEIHSSLEIIHKNALGTF